jgi:DNA (cytosine-5)-methyltransferase 1
MYGFPCNDFSVVGKSKGLKGKYGPLYKYGVRYLDQSNPFFFLAENVSGISSSDSGKSFERIQRELAEAGEYGYSLTTHLYKFEEYGVPQSRHRYIIVGIRNDLGLRFEVPRPTSDNPMSCREAIEVPPIPQDAKNQELTAQSDVVVRRLEHIRPGENAWTADLPEDLKLDVKGAKLSQIYKRLDPNKPAYTVTGSGGGGTHVYHWSEPRALTNRERARLQTFPDWFEFFGSKESVRKQIGMAVPPNGAQIILEAVLKTLAGAKYDSVEPSYGYL